MGVGYEAIEVIKKGFNSNFSSEREFRERVIGRLLEYLGWNSDGDVQYEYAIPIATTTLRVDYLVGHSQPFALEAKQPNVDISPGSSPWNQILDYLKLDKTIRYGVLYNGKALYIMRGGMERPLVSWISQYDFSAFEYLKKSSYPSLLDLEVFLGNTDIKSRTDLTNSISKFQGRNDDLSSADDYFEILFNRTKLKEKWSLYMIGVTFASILAIGFVIGDSTSPPLALEAVDILMALGFLISIAASIFYYFKVRSLKRKKARIK